MKTTNTFFLLLTLCFTGSIHAQILYTDVKPDHVQKASGSKGFDIDKDGKADLTFTLFIIDPKTDIWCTVTPADSMEVLMNESYAKRLNKGDEIKDGGTWKTFENMGIAFLTSGAVEGPWPASGDHYLAFRFKHAGSFHYGWLLLSVDAGVKGFTIREYAYESGVNTTILAGDVPFTGIGDLQRSPRFTFERHGNILAIQGQQGNLHIALFSITGALLRDLPVKAPSYPLDLSGLQPGIYLVSASDERGREVVKVRVE